MSTKASRPKPADEIPARPADAVPPTMPAGQGPIWDEFAERWAHLLESGAAGDQP